MDAPKRSPWVCPSPPAPAEGHKRRHSAAVIQHRAFSESPEVSHGNLGADAISGSATSPPRPPAPLAAIRPCGMCPEQGQPLTPSCWALASARSPPHPLFALPLSCCLILSDAIYFYSLLQPCER